MVHLTPVSVSGNCLSQRLGSKAATWKDCTVTEPQQLDTEETGLNLFDDRASAVGSFPNSMLGYDKHSVDSYVRELENKVAELKAQARESARETKYVRDAVGDTDFSRLGAHATGLLRAAEAQAGDLIDRAQHEAERIKAEARRTASVLRESAQQEADDVRLTGLAGLRQLRQEQAEAGKTALEMARRDGELIVQDANVRAKAIVDAATAKASSAIEAAGSEAERVMKEAERKAAELLAESQSAAEQSATEIARNAKLADESITQRLQQADKNAAAAAERAAAAREEAQQIRAEAVKTAEEIKMLATRQSEETLEVMRARARDADADLEERVAWRKEQLEREIASLEARRANALSQLGNLRALAEESSDQFSDDHTVVLPSFTDSADETTTINRHEPRR